MHKTLFPRFDLSKGFLYIYSILQGMKAILKTENSHLINKSALQIRKLPVFILVAITSADYKIIDPFFPK